MSAEDVRDSPVCVVGMGRSGTSLTARVLNLLGVDLGSERGMVLSSPQNAKGYWERQAIYEINEWLLTALGGSYAAPPPLEPGWERAPELEPLRRRARTLLAETFEGAGLWGFKDARVSLTLPFWRELVPHLRYVVCVRDPREVAASFLRYPSDGSFEGADWSELWVRSTASALVHTRGSRRVIVFYEDYFTDLRAQVELLASFIERPIADEAFAAVEEFFDRDLRHHWTGAAADAVGSGEDAANRLHAALRALPRVPSASAVEQVESLARRLLAAGEERPERARSATAVAPTMLRNFPPDLNAPGLAYFGIHGDGWLDQESQVFLAGGAAATLVVRAQVLQVEGQHLDVLVDGRQVASIAASAGPLDVRAAIPASGGRRRVDLRWAAATPLAPPDPRRAAARLTFVGVV